MRALIAVVVLAACAGTRPAVTPTLSELPGDATKRDAVLDSANAQPGPEHHAKLKPKEHKAETAAATAAAVLGSILSDHTNTTIGTAVLIDETKPVTRKQPKRQGSGDAGSDDEAPPVDAVPEGPLVPWVQLHPQQP
jgi:hypothetical protein